MKGKRYSILVELKRGKGTRSKQLIEERVFNAVGDSEEAKLARVTCAGYLWGMVKRGYITKTETGSYQITDAGKEIVARTNENAQEEHAATETAEAEQTTPTEG